ncbi:MAG: DUF721 domain-containing protein [Acidaminococcaceae bacterium]
MKNVEKIIFKLLDNDLARERFLVQFLLHNWGVLFGENIAKHSKPLRLEQGVLYVNTDNPAWSHNLLMMKNQLLAKINNTVPKGDRKKALSIVIKDIIFYYGNVEKVKRLEAQKAVEYPLLELNEQEKNAIIKRTENIKNLVMQAAFVKLMSEDFRRKKSLLAVGKKQCLECGVILQNEEQYCAVCARTKQELLKAKLKETLVEAPWLSYGECINYVKCDKMLFSEIRDYLKLNTYKKLMAATCDDETKVFAVMLETYTTPEQLTTEFITETVEEIRRKYDVSSFGSSLRYKKQ